MHLKEQVVGQLWVRAVAYTGDLALVEKGLQGAGKRAPHPHECESAVRPSQLALALWMLLLHSDG